MGKPNDSNESFFNYYEFLGFEKDASTSVILKLFQDAIKANHPDKYPVSTHGEQKNQAQDGLTARLNAGKDLFTVPENRAKLTAWEKTHEKELATYWMGRAFKAGGAWGGFAAGEDSEVNEDEKGGVHRGCPLGLFDKDPAPKRVVMGTFDVNGKIMRRLVMVDEYGIQITTPTDEPDKYGKSSRAASIARNQIQPRQGWQGLTGAAEEAKVFDALQLSNLTKGWGWVSNGHRIAHPNLRKDLQGARQRVQNSINYEELRLVRKGRVEKDKSKAKAVAFVDVLAKRFAEVIAASKKEVDADELWVRAAILLDTLNVELYKQMEEMSLDAAIGLHKAGKGGK